MIDYMEIILKPLEISSRTVRTDSNAQTASVKNPSSCHPRIWNQSRSLKENHSECLFSWPGDRSPGFENEVVEEVIFRSTDIRYRNTTAKQKMKTELSKKKDGKMPSDLLDGRASTTV